MLQCKVVYLLCLLHKRIIAFTEMQTHFHRQCLTQSKRSPSELAGPGLNRICLVNFFDKTNSNCHNLLGTETGSSYFFCFILVYPNYGQLSKGGWVLHLVWEVLWRHSQGSFPLWHGNGCHTHKVKITWQIQPGARNPETSNSGINVSKSLICWSRSSSDENGILFSYKWIVWNLKPECSVLT